MEKNDKYSDGRKLRQSAEAELEASVEKDTDLSDSSPQDIQRLIHELQVHQIELKMQNDELRRIAVDLERVRDKFTHTPVNYVF